MAKKLCFMIKRTFSLLIMIIFTSYLTRVYSQLVIPKGKVEVLAIRGKVVFGGSELRRGDNFEFKPGISAMDQLKFSSATDWIKLMEINSNKVYHYYRQKKYACNNCLFTRGVFFKFSSRVDPSDYFNRRLFFLFEPDTILLLRKSINFNPNNVPIFQIIVNDKIYNRVVGSQDTIIISHDNLFGFADEEQILWPSFNTDSIRLSYYDKITHIQTIPVIPWFHIKFIEDAIPFFHNMEMTSEEICNELIENYIDLKYLTERKGFDNTEVTKKWLKDNLDTIISGNPL